ncbi:hypothetical protein BO78DRAFT_193606 [Aspergillus sclerotiicarbonarius CBS 121057]|uniref:Uncharacterized protein n=1 Tax=Aspergillus sclerotiicarbonarius (strain CBS 121057 / IBT 28362) TaxID=1448318 RepID=A0A319E0S4_ASPSB|nr:hypothetical protein BO78DRAFT_193606 [Aspergillus sclerotiicarbonarius CBS 121057]
MKMRGQRAKRRVINAPGKFFQAGLSGWRVKRRRRGGGRSAYQTESKETREVKRRQEAKRPGTLSGDRTAMADGGGRIKQRFFHTGEGRRGGGRCALITARCG